MSALAGCCRVGPGIATLVPDLLFDATTVTPDAGGLVTQWANQGRLGSAYDLVPVANGAQYVRSAGQSYVRFTGGDVLQTRSDYHQLSAPRTLLLRVWLSPDALANGRNLTGYGANAYHQLSDVLVVGGQVLLHIYGDAFSYFANHIPAGQFITLTYRATAPIQGAQPLFATLDGAIATESGPVAGLQDELPAGPMFFGGGRYQDYNKANEIRLQKMAFYGAALSDAQFQVALAAF